VVIEQGAIKLIHSFRESNPENMLLDIPKILGIFEAKYAKKINKIIFTGGHSANQGLVESASAKIDRKIFPGNPFLNIKFNTQLSGALKEISPYMAVAVGGAMREI
jgi:Tfp pilus assembly PilM family ATPase